MPRMKYRSMQWSKVIDIKWCFDVILLIFCGFSNA